MMRQRGDQWPGNAVRHPATYFGEPPLVRGFVRALDVAYGWGMSSHARAFRGADRSNVESGFAYAGYEPALQRFAGGMITPSQAHIRMGLNQLLPGTVGLPGDAQAPHPATVAVPATVADQLPGAPW